MSEESCGGGGSSKKTLSEDEILSLLQSERKLNARFGEAFPGVPVNLLSSQKKLDALTWLSVIKGVPPSSPDGSPGERSEVPDPTEY